MKLHRFRFAIITSLFILSSACACFAQQANFSGTWTVNKGKIQFDEAPEWVLPKSFVITQQKDNIDIERILLDEQSQEHPFKESLTFDGKATTNTTYNQVKKTSTIAWMADGQSFMLSTTGVTVDGQPGSSSKEIWSLEDEGKTLVIDRSVKQPDGLEYTIKAYYDKKE